MAGSRLLLDTVTIIGILTGEFDLDERLQVADTVYAPSIAFGELFAGALKSTFVRANLDNVEQFADGAGILSCDMGTARLYGQVKNELRKIGRPIPDNDAWIAAIAIQFDLTLVTRDAHFRNVSGLQLEMW
jgi:tRNA(fMet)-specific endonuclease VapC